MTLDAASGRDLSYSYWTTDGEALAGEDYEGLRNEFVIPAGVTTAILAVPLVDDAMPEGPGTFTVSLMNSRDTGVGIAQALGVIEDDEGTEGKVRTSTTRFGRTVATQVLESVEDRMNGDSNGSRVSLGLDVMQTRFQVASRETLGQSWSDVGSGRTHSLESMAANCLGTVHSWSSRRSPPAGSPGVGPSGVGDRRCASAAATTGISVNGAVLTTAVGMDYRRDRILAGFALANSSGNGRFGGEGSERNSRNGEDVAKSRIATLSPYVRVRLDDRISVWGLGGYGIGTASLAVEDDKRDLSHAPGGDRSSREPLAGNGRQPSPTGPEGGYVLDAGRCRRYGGAPCQYGPRFRRPGPGGRLRAARIALGRRDHAESGSRAPV